METQHPELEKQCRLLLLRFPVGQESDLVVEGRGINRLSEAVGHCVRPTAEFPV